VLTIDGAHGEGGGQVLRTALGLAIVTGQPVTLVDIRAKRKEPGLRRQHLTAVQAAAAVGAARVAGAELGSTRLAFCPSAPCSGHHRFAIGTAGSATLVLQTVLPALWAAAGPSTIELAGGTHNPMAPPFDFLAQAFAPIVRRMGAGLDLELLRHGFFPAGGGLVRATVTPARWRQVAREQPIERSRLAVRIVNANLPAHIAEREARVIAAGLQLPAARIVREEVAADGPGNAVMIALAGAESSELVMSLAERGLPAEAVAERAVREAERLLRAGVPVGEHLADQLLLPMALAGGGSFLTTAPSEHLRTNAWVIGHFLPVAIELAETAGRCRVTVRPR